MNCSLCDCNALVYDIGSAMIRAGIAGNAFPDIQTPSVASFVMEDGNLDFSFDESLLYSNFERGTVNIVDEKYCITDSELFENFLTYTHKKMNVNPADYSVLYTAPAHLITTKEHSENWGKRICDVSFEKLDHPAICLSPDASLAAYAHCMQTATVVDFGWSCLRVIPVIEGKTQVDHIQIHPIGGYGLSQLLYEQLSTRNIPLVPKNPNWSDGQWALHQYRRATNIIESCATYAQNTLPEDFLYFLDGKPIDLQTEMKLQAALHWDEIDNDETTPGSVPPLPIMIQNAINECPDEHKRLLWKGIVTSGGFSAQASFIDKLQIELNKLVDPSIDNKINFPMHEMVRGSNTVWVGGSILASSSVFPRFLITKEEWKEYGESILSLKCQ